VEAVADLQVFRSEPDAEFLALQERIEVADEGVVLRGVADEAGEVFERFADE
jgi:hypothetical protein